MAAKDRCQACDDKLRTPEDRESQACGACRGCDWWDKNRAGIIMAMRLARRRRK